jgi:CubicO group peptidase (beta-lactamase class C family)
MLGGAVGRRACLVPPLARPRCQALPSRSVLGPPAIPPLRPPPCCGPTRPVGCPGGSAAPAGALAGETISLLADSSERRGELLQELARSYASESTLKGMLLFDCARFLPLEAMAQCYSESWPYYPDGWALFAVLAAGPEAAGAGAGAAAGGGTR